MAFSMAGAEARVATLFDDASPRLQRQRALVVGEGMAGGRPVVVAANDPLQLRGAIGITEAHALTQALARARELGVPIVLVLDSSGARVDEGLPALGAFRPLFREALLARLAGVRMFALLGAACFGGASLLACLCGQRSYLERTRLAASGPRVIEAAQGRAVFDASDEEAVQALLGAGARRRWHPRDRQRGGSLAAAREALHLWLREEEDAFDFQLQQMRLRERLQTLPEPSPRAALPVTTGVDVLLPPGYVPDFTGRLMQALPPSGSRKPVFVGALGGDPLSAKDSAALSAMLLGLQPGHAHSPVILLLDARAHAATIDDERVLLTDYLVHLGLVIASLHRAGHRIALWVVGSASGASYVAFAAGADTVSATPDAHIEILPPAARASIIGDRAQSTAGPDGWLAAGVADALLDKRLSGPRNQSSG